MYILARLYYVKVKIIWDKIKWINFFLLKNVSMHNNIAETLILVDTQIVMLALAQKESECLWHYSVCKIILKKIWARLLMGALKIWS